MEPGSVDRGAEDELNQTLDGANMPLREDLGPDNSGLEAGDEVRLFENFDISTDERAESEGDLRVPAEGTSTVTAEDTLVIRGKRERADEPEESVGSLGVEPAQIVEKLKDAFRRVSRQIVGREELLNQTMYALLTREHQLIYSRAGMAKSLYADAVFGQFGDAQTFSTQLTKGTTEDGLVGAINIDELKKGNVVHNVKGSIVDARLAFLDEIFDANDVALRSLLGILNERVFRKGKQYVEAELHSAIATSNYVRQNDVTEAVIDRFAFRSVLLPDDDPYTELRIDKAYERTAGDVVRPAEEQRLSIRELDYLADIVEGRVPGVQITAPAHVLFLKNAIIHEYVRAINEARAEEDKSEIYISPRTMAKTRDLLNAAALLRGRSTVTTEDLADLKYMVTTIGDPDGQEEVFDRAVERVMSGVDANDLKAVDFLMEAHELIEGMISKVRQGEKIETSFMERVKLFFGIATLGDLTFGDLKRVIERVNGNHELVRRLRSGILKRIDYEKERFDDGNEAVLL